MMNIRRVRYALALILVLTLSIASLGGCHRTAEAQEAKQASPTPEAASSEPAQAPAAPSYTEEQRAQNIATFQATWETIRDTHWDKSMHGMDWDAVRAEMMPKVEAAQSQDEFHAVLQEMIGRFDQSHFTVVPSRGYDALMARSESSDSAAPGSTGLDVRMVEEMALVVGVREGSPASQAGVGMGWRILKVDGREVGPFIATATEAFEGKTMYELYRHHTLLAGIGGTVGEEKSIVFEDGTGKEVEVKLTLVEEQGQPYKLGIFPAGYIWFESKWIGDDIGYIAFNGFMDPVRLSAEYEKAIKEFMNAKGIVIDVRGNGGGTPFLAMGMAGWLIGEEGQYFGVMKTRDADLKYNVNPRIETYKGPVAVLIDGSSASCAEIFPAGLRDMGRARIFGTRTAGAVLPASFKKLPNGDMLYYPIADYISKNGDRLEGVGVEPDENTPHTRKDLLVGRDNALAAATEWIRNPPASAE